MYKDVHGAIVGVLVSAAAPMAIDAKPHDDVRDLGDVHKGCQKGGEAV